MSSGEDLEAEFLQPPRARLAVDELALRRLVVRHIVEISLRQQRRERILKKLA